MKIVISFSTLETERVHSFDFSCSGEKGIEKKLKQRSLRDRVLVGWDARSDIEIHDVVTLFHKPSVRSRALWRIWIPNVVKWQRATGSNPFCHFAVFKMTCNYSAWRALHRNYNDGEQYSRRKCVAKLSDQVLIFFILFSFQFFFKTTSKLVNFGSNFTFDQYFWFLVSIDFLTRKKKTFRIELESKISNWTIQS